MPNHTTEINVFFRRNGNPVWPAVPIIQMTGAGTITLQRAPRRNWEFSDFMFYDQADPDTRTSPPDFGEPNVSADRIEITDDVTIQGHYWYKYQVTKNGASHWSPDPEIDNNPQP